MNAGTVLGCPVRQITLREFLVMCAWLVCVSPMLAWANSDTGMSQVDVQSPPTVAPNAICTTCDIDDPPPKPTRSAQFVSQTVPAVMLAGMTQTVTIKFKNSGTLAWTSANNYKLGSQNPGDNIVWGARRVELSKTVAPGEIATFSFQIKAPLTAGTYNFQWRMVMEGVAWFGTLSTNVAIKVVSGSIGAAPNPCNIPAGASTCTATINWSSSSSSAEVWVGTTPQLFARGKSGSQAAT